MQFNQKTSSVGNIDLIPNGTLAWLAISVKAVKIGKAKDDGKPGGRYAELELTVVSGPFTKRKIFTNINDPEYANNSEQARMMGFGALSRMLESSQLVKVEDPLSYERFNNVNFEGILGQLDGKVVAGKIKIKPEGNGFPAKNEIADFLSPNPVSTSNKDFVKLVAQGQAAQGQQASGQTSAPVAAGPTWTAPPAPAVPSASGFPPSGGFPPAPQPATAPAPAPAAQPAVSAWLAQAQPVTTGS